MTKPFTTLLFDLDNTLMDRDRTFRSFSETFVRDHLGHLEPAEQLAVVEDMIVRDADGYRDKDGFFAELSEVLPWQTRLTAAEIRAYYDRSYMGHGAAMDGAEELLAYCRDKGYRLGMITNGDSGLQNTKIDLLRLRGHFDDIVISGEVSLRKPAPDIYRLALERIGAQPEEALFIGDHPVNDIWGAGKAGIRGIWLRRQHPWDPELDVLPWQTVDSLHELKEHL